ncbi:alpha/beta hydrolase [Neobacillus drentensis]|jgi:alpha-beta hydrolase superfamily lysophospholipase|uniref:alpha/beta hydrolase n=1 Tax=Neobacillus drentensis TaxID=220684 RepID=UPI002FFD594A
MKKEGKFKGVNGVELFYQVLYPKATAPKAAVILVHGHGDHSGGLQNLSTSLVNQDYLVYGLDLRGHGKSTGKRGYIKEWDEYRNDLHEFRKLVASEVPALPLFIAGHSIGGVIVLDYTLDYSEGLAGIIAISPAISYEVTPSERLLITLMGKLKPDYSIVKTGNPQILTKDPVELDRLAADELRHDVVTPGLGRGLMRAVARLANEAKSIKLPFLLQYGLEDELTPPAKLRQFFDTVSSPNKQKVEYPQMRHRPFDDLEREQFFEDMIHWLDEQVGNL